MLNIRAAPTTRLPRALRTSMRTLTMVSISSSAMLGSNYLNNRKKAPARGVPAGTMRVRTRPSLRTRKQGTGGIPELKTGYQGQI